MKCQGNSYDYYDEEDEYEKECEREMDELMKELHSYEEWAYYNGEDYADIRPEDYGLSESYDEDSALAEEVLSERCGPNDVDNYEIEEIMDSIYPEEDYDESFYSESDAPVPEDEFDLDEINFDNPQEEGAAEADGMPDDEQFETTVEIDLNELPEEDIKEDSNEDGNEDFDIPF